jgi:hypothetical protein
MKPLMYYPRTCTYFVSPFPLMESTFTEIQIEMIKRLLGFA